MEGVHMQQAGRLAYETKPRCIPELFSFYSHEKSTSVKSNRD